MMRANTSYLLGVALTSVLIVALPLLVLLMICLAGLSLLAAATHPH